MRRKDREVTSKEEQLAILENSAVCRLAMVDDGKPYLVPLNFGYDWQGDNLQLYFHCAKEGRKIDVLSRNNHVCFELDGAHQLIEGNVPCSYSFAFESLIGFGTAEFVEEATEKEKGMQLIMKHQAGLTELSFPAQMLNSIAIIKVTVSEVTGKRSAAPNKD